MRSIKNILLAISAVLLVVGSASAQSSGTSSGSSGRSSSGSSSGGGIRGWGPRIGLASDPDQLILGLHMDAGRFAPQVRFQPDVELGVGDDVVILDFTGAVHYLFRTQGDLKPYAGGGLTIGFIDVDGRNDNDVDWAIEFQGGLAWSIGSGYDQFFLEAALLGGGLQDFKLIAGWTF